MLELKGITKIYPSGKGVFECSLTAAPGKITGLTGPNGCGKTSLFRILAGLQRPDQGKILYNGRELSRYPQRQVGYLSEERTVYPDCLVIEFVRLAGKLKGLSEPELRSRIDKWLTLTGLAEERYQRIRNLSKGAQQLVQLIAAAIGEYGILVLDEPFNGLDQERQTRLISILKDYRRDRVVLVSLHEASLMPQVLDAEIRLDQGKVLR